MARTHLLDSLDSHNTKVNEKAVVEQEKEDFGGKGSIDDKLVDLESRMGQSLLDEIRFVEVVQVKFSAYGAVRVGVVEGIEDSKIKKASRFRRV
ncbi:hypothetical protein L484_014862 [Morus notabilis]|uniref:Uncharacterized protein n=1 Tax=Morus notabilis TaxID=981085 RepID=W9SA30_9ROSA|nr:hypothetical protein L484_014862 [Morus notabilis]